VPDVLGSVRPDSWDFPLFLHVGGAMIAVGGLLAGGTALAVAGTSVRVLRCGFWSLLAVALPGVIVMRIGAQWIYNREGFDASPSNPTWLGIGFITADAGIALLFIALVVGAFGVRRLSRGSGTGLLRVSMVLSFVTLAAYLVTVWAMGAKPG